MSEFGGLWKQQNNPACTKMTVMASFVADGHQRKKKKKKILRNSNSASVLSVFVHFPHPSITHSKMMEQLTDDWFDWITDRLINWLLFHLLLGALMVDWSVVWLARSLTVVWLLAGLFDWLIDWLAGDMQVPHLWIGTMTAKLWAHKYTRLKQNSIDSTSLSICLMRVHRWNYRSAAASIEGRTDYARDKIQTLVLER